MNETSTKVIRSQSNRIFAVCGKGGVGKTAFTAMLTKVLVESGKAGKLLVIDADPALGLTHALGMRIEKTMGQVREDIINAARAGTDAGMVEIASMLDYMVLEALAESDHMALLAMGRSESLGCFCSVNDILRDAIKILSSKFDTILIDGEAGLEQINRQVVDELDSLIIVTDTSSRGLKTVALLKEMVEENNVIQCSRTGVVFNRVQDNEAYLAEAAANIDIDVFGFVPQDSTINSYDLVGRSLAELPNSSDALCEVEKIAAKLLF